MTNQQFFKVEKSLKQYMNYYLNEPNDFNLKLLYNVFYLHKEALGFKHNFQFLEEIEKKNLELACELDILLDH